MKAATLNFSANELTPIFERLPSLDKNNAVLITAYLNLICNKVIENGNFEKSSQTDDILYQKVISYIADNFAEKITLKQIADKLNYNEKYLSSAIHSLTGIHFSDLVAVYRIEGAKERLANSERSIAEIALECGFSAVNTFNRKFKKTVSMTPTEYRKIYNNGYCKSK